MAVIKLEIEEPEAEDERPARFEEESSGPVEVEQPLPVVENARAQEEPPAVPIQEEAPKLKQQTGPKKGPLSGDYRCPYCLFTCHDQANKNAHKKCHNRYQKKKGDKICEICFKLFPKKAYKTTLQKWLDYHIENHH